MSTKVCASVLVRRLISLLISPLISPFISTMAAAAPALCAQAPGREGARIVSRAEIRSAMEEVRGYDPTATTNGARFQAEVLLSLARRVNAEGGARPPFFVDHGDWFAAALDRAGLRPEQAPTFLRLGYEYAQDMRVDYGNDRVVRRVVEGPTPAVALFVRIGWPEKPGRPRSYSYDDLLSTPQLKVTNESLITYRLLDYGDMVMYDDVQGLLGRPTSGALGFLFRIIGEGHVVQNRMAISEDGLQISRARAKKLFVEVQATVTVHPDGRTEKDLPPARPDLEALARKLQRPMKVEYPP